MKEFRKIFLAAAGLCAMLGSLTPVIAENKDDPAFDEWLDEQFTELVESDYTSMHFYMRYWREAGLTKPDVNFGDPSLESYDDAVKDCEETLQELAEFDYDKLSVRQQHDYDAIRFSQEKIKVLNEYPMMDFAFDPANCIVDNLNTNLTEFVFYDAEDFDDYITLEKSAIDYLDGIMELTKKQASEGYFLIDSALDQTLSEIRKFTDNKENNPLVVIFEKNVDASKELSNSKKEKLKSKNEDFVLNTYIPYLENMMDELEKLRGSRKGGDSYADLKDGKAYYAAFLQNAACLDRTPEEILKICTDYLKGLLPKYINILMYNQEDAYSGQLEFEDAEEILNYLKGHLDGFPEIPETAFTVSYLDPSLASDSIGAYYMVPPVDDYGNNVIKVNGSNVEDVNNLYYYLAHEGYPGHLFAHTWSHEDGEKPVRQVLSFLGYGEGWAMYASGRMWHKSGLDQLSAEFNRLDWDLNYVLMAAADIGVNALGWKEKDLRKYLTDLELNGEVAADLYTSACETPGSLVPYGVGLAFMDTLRDRAEAQLGKDFDEVEYHEVVLRYSERSLDALEQDVKAWMESKGVAYEPDAPLPVDPVPASQSDLIKYISLGAGVLVVLLVVVILRSRNKRKDPFGA